MIKDGKEYIMTPNGVCKSCKGFSLFDEDCGECHKRRKRTSMAFNPTILSDKVLETITDTSVTIPEPVGNRSENDLKEFIKDLINTEQLAELRKFLSDYRIPCNCISMEYTCLGHQLAELFDLDDVMPEPTEFKKYDSILSALPKVPWDRKGSRVLSKNKEEDE